MMPSSEVVLMLGLMFGFIGAVIALQAFQGPPAPRRPEDTPAE